MEKISLEQIEKSKSESRQSLETLKKAMEETKKERREATELIKKSGLKLAYFDPISIAYTAGQETKTTIVTFTVRSKRDQFCRAEARVALAKHIAQNTNTLEVSSPVGLIKTDREVFAVSLVEDISKYVVNNFSNVPNYFRKAASLVREQGLIKEQLREKRSLIDLMEGSVDELISQLDKVSDRIIDLLDSKDDEYVLLS